MAFVVELVILIFALCVQRLSIGNRNRGVAGKRVLLFVQWCAGIRGRGINGEVSRKLGIRGKCDS